MTRIEPCHDTHELYISDGRFSDVFTHTHRLHLVNSFLGGTKRYCSLTIRPGLGSILDTVSEDTEDTSHFCILSVCCILDTLPGIFIK